MVCPVVRVDDNALWKRHAALVQRSVKNFIYDTLVSGTGVLEAERHALVTKRAPVRSGERCLVAISPGHGNLMLALRQVDGAEDLCLTQLREHKVDARHDVWTRLGLGVQSSVVHVLVLKFFIFINTIYVLKLKKMLQN